VTWPTRIIKDWEHFLKLCALFERNENDQQASLLLRGQSDASWRLASTLTRVAGPNANEQSVLALETSLLRAFQDGFDECAGVVPRPNDEQVFEWWALMQHYGAPSRLLDWSTSLRVAAYFAASDAWLTDGAVWVLSPWVAMQGAGLGLEPDMPLEKYASEMGTPHVVLSMPARMPTDRMAAQKGHFTFGLNVGLDQQQAIEEMFRDERIESADQIHMKLIIPAGQKPEYLRCLEELGVSAKTLFPGLDGLGRSVTEFARQNSRPV
jgi:hypothetical protein